MRVWIANPFDNLPEEGCRPQRFWLMAEAFARAGHETVLWTQDWRHATKTRRAPGVTDAGSFSVRKIHVPGYGKNICLARIWSHWRLAANWRAEAERSEKPDLIVVSSPPLFLGRAVRKYCEAAGAKYVVDVMDAWPETFERVLPRWTLAWARGIVRRNYCGAAGITAVAKRYVELVESYGAKCPVRLFHHGIELSGGIRKVPSVPDREGNGVKIAYVGNMSLSYDLATAIDAVKRDEELELELAGAGPDEARLRERAAGCSRIRFRGYLGEAEMREMLAGADVGLVPMFDDSCVGVPYKLADYAAANLPVASSLHGETEELLAKFGAGATYEAGDCGGLCRTVRTAKGMRNGVSALAETFDAASIYAAYVEFVAGLW